MNCVSRPLFIPQFVNVQYIRATKPHELTRANFPPRSVVGYYKQKWKGHYFSATHFHHQHYHSGTTAGCTESP